MKTRLLSIIFQLLAFGINCVGQTINGTITDQKGDTISFATVVIIDHGQEAFTTMSDLDGLFIFKEQTDFRNKKIYAKYGECSSDTIAITQNNRTNLKLIVTIKNSCAPKIETSGCRHNYIIKGMYYIDISDLSNAELKIVTGEQIETKALYSPYDYQMIEENKKYKADNGEIFTGQQLIKIKNLPLKNWEKADFIPIDEK